MAESFEDKLVETVCSYPHLYDESVPRHSYESSCLEINIILEMLEKLSGGDADGMFFTA